MGTTVIRPAGDDDLGGVARLRWEWLLENQGSPATSYEEFASAFVGWAQANRSSHRCLIMVENDVVIGMAWLAIIRRVPTPSTLQRISGDLQSMYVVPARRGAGLGGQLIDAVVDLAGRLGVKHLTVHSSAKAISAYARHGFSTSPDLLCAEPVV
ncbi:GNAT family N-acetyltransferase [Nocardia sp. NPDC057030]|uniref:GNAT family N-acetyltransferase n=1 Tax=unclassified Nocardia TaxID=2637762 RepID=UPI00362FD00E